MVDEQVAHAIVLVEDASVAFICRELVLRAH